MKNTLFSLLKFLIGWPLALVAFYFILRIISPQLPTLFANLATLNIPLFLLGVSCFILFYGAKSYIWHLLLVASGYHLSFKKSCFLWASSEMKRYIPGNIWSFLSRAVLFSEQNVSKKDIAKCLIIEAELLIFGAAIVSLLSLPLLTNFGLLQISSLWTYLICILFGIILSVYVFGKHITTFLPKKLQHVYRLFFPQFSPLTILSLIFFNTVAFVLFGLGYYFIIASYISFDPNLLWQIVGFSVLAFLLGYLSLLTPAGFGVREGALVMGLAKITTFATAGFVALLTRMVMIFSEVIFVLLAFMWYTNRNKIVNHIAQWIKTHKHETVLFCLFLIYVVYITTISFLRYDNFYTGRFDLGNMSQTVWNTAQGKIFQFTNPDGTEIISRLAFHADFILIFFAPFYWIWDSPKMLLLIQTLIVAAGSFFVYLLGKQVLNNKHLALTFAFVYLINPSVQRANLYDFHAVALATTFLLATFYFFQQRRYKLFLFFAILAGLCKEQVWIIIGIFGLFLFAQHKKRLFGTALFILSFAFSYFLISFAIPNSYGSQHFALSYYAEFGDKPATVIKTILLSPDKVLNTLLQEDRIQFLKQIFSPLGYISLLAPIYLVFIIPDLMLKLLSNNPNFYQIYYQYTAELSPFIFISAIYAALIVKKLLAKTNNETIKQWGNVVLIFYLLSTSLYAAYLYGPLPGAKTPNLDMITKPVENKETIDKALTTIPHNAKVAASNTIASHLSHRDYIYVLPFGADKAEYLVFFDAADKQMIPKFRSNAEYILLVDKEPFVMFKKMYYHK